MEDGEAWGVFYKDFWEKKPRILKYGYMFIKAKPSYWTTFPNYAEILTNEWMNETKWEHRKFFHDFLWLHSAVLCG